MMGYRLSPYLVTKDMLVVEQIIRGDKDDKSNVLRWGKVILNLPGLEKYNPSRLCVYKVREDRKIASDVFWYIDDGRSTTPSEVECWKIARKISSTLSFLGLQDAGRK